VDGLEVLCQSRSKLEAHDTSDVITVKIRSVCEFLMGIALRFAETPAKSCQIES
jgi:hypothetical protein